MSTKHFRFQQLALKSKVSSLASPHFKMHATRISSQHTREWPPAPALDDQHLHLRSGAVEPKDLLENNRSIATVEAHRCLHCCPFSIKELTVLPNLYFLMTPTSLLVQQLRYLLCCVRALGSDSSFSFVSGASISVRRFIKNPYRISTYQGNVNL